MISLKCCWGTLVDAAGQSPRWKGNEHAIRITERAMHLRATTQTPLRQSSCHWTNPKRVLIGAKCSSHSDGGLRSPASVALKEWAALVAAIGEGKQTILLRKGGIREGPFKPVSSSFYLFPTSFHSEGSLLKPYAEQTYSKVLLHSLQPTRVQTKRCQKGMAGCWMCRIT